VNLVAEDKQKISSKDEFQAFLDRMRAGQGSGYRPIDDIPVVRVVDQGKKDTFYTLWRKDNGFALVSFEGLTAIKPENSSAPQQPVQESAQKKGWVYSLERDRENMQTARENVSRRAARGAEQPLIDRPNIEAPPPVDVFYNPKTRQQAPGNAYYWSNSGEISQKDPSYYVGQAGITEANSNGLNTVKHQTKGELLPIPMAKVDPKTLAAAGGVLTDAVLATDLRSKGYQYGVFSEPSTDRRVTSAPQSEVMKALQQSQVELIETGLGKRTPEISIRRQDIASISPKIEVTESEAQRLIKEALERQQEFIRNQGKQTPPAPATGTRAPDNTAGLPPEVTGVLAAMGRAPAGTAPPATPVSKGEIVKQSQAELPRTFETAAAPGAPAPAATVVAAAGQSAKTLADMGVLGNPTAKLEVNHEAALNASAAIRDKTLTSAQIATVIQSFKGDDKLKGFAAALEKQSKASDPAQGATVAGDEIHKARQALNKDERASRRSERAVSPEEALDRVRRGMAQASDPAFIEDAIRRVEPTLRGAVSPAARQEAALIDGLMKDPKTDAELKKRLNESLQKAGMNPDRLPEGTREFIASKALEQVGQRRAEIAKAEKEGGQEAARAKLIEIAQQGINKGIQEIQSGVKPEVQKKPDQGSPGYSPDEIRRMQEEALGRAGKGVTVKP
jgi:hypothetical protein